MQVSKVCRRHLQKISHIIIAKKTERSGHDMNETLQDLEQKREVVKKDIDFLFETLQMEIIKATKKHPMN